MVERPERVYVAHQVSTRLGCFGYVAVAIDLNEVGFEPLRGALTGVDVCLILDPYIEHGPLYDFGLSDIRDVLDCYSIPYTGPRFSASRLTANKVLTKIMMEGIGRSNSIPYRILRSTGDLATAFSDIGDPLIVKPIDRGGGEDVRILTRCGAAADELASLLKRHPAVLCERFIDGFEVCIPVVRLHGSIASMAPVEIELTESRIFDQTTKSKDAFRQIIPARIANSIEQDIRSGAELLYDTVRFKGLLRVDFMIAGERAYFLEANSYPSLGEKIGLSVPSARHAGVSYIDMMEAIIFDT